MGDADGLEFLLRHRHAIQANESEQARAHDVAAGPVVGVHQHDLGEHVADRARATPGLAGVAQPDHVFGEAETARIARAGLRRLNHVETLLAEAGEDLRGRDRLEPR